MKELKEYHKRVLKELENPQNWKPNVHKIARETGIPEQPVRYAIERAKRKKGVKMYIEVEI